MNFTNIAKSNFQGWKLCAVNVFHYVQIDWFILKSFQVSIYVALLF